jgi:chemotaxis protein MotB
MRVKRHQATVDSQRWMVTFSDLVTLLLTFFVLTLSMSSMDGGRLQRAFGRSDLNGEGGAALVNLEPQAEKKQPGWGGGGEQEVIELRALEESVAEEIGDLGLETAVDVRDKRRGVVLTLEGDILFATGKAELRAPGREVLERLLPVLRRASVLMSIEGHTDAMVSRSWTYRDNWDLSVARATTVARFFEDAGINPARLAVAGYGASRPRAIGPPRDVGYLNRRVELVLSIDHRVEDIRFD